ncbi:hypothetical protein SAMN02787076_06200 [Rhizobacter sp. OV335]|nr:hypothetical protein SAMN02787076_06200 [Rhizobacter sp. OV335]
MTHDPREWDLTTEADALRRTHEIGMKIAETWAGVDEAPGFHRLPEKALCPDPEHGLPNFLYIPSGMRYVHYCPTCRQKSVAQSPHATCTVAR